MTSLPDKVKIEIVDNGVGFDEADMPLVFQAFKKLDINTQGAGLGLHITKTMLEKAGGSLALRSEKGKGTTFEAVIPVSWAVSVEPDRDGAVGLDRRQIRPARNASTASESRSVLDGRDRQKNEDPIERQSHKSTPIGSSTSHQHKPERHAVESLRVLIVDDNHICLKLLGMSLRRSPIRIDLHEAHDGAQAVEVFRKARPDLVLTDVCMPGLDGIAAAERMREFEAEEKMPRSAIYAVTALGATDPRSKSMGLNGTADLDGWLVKGQDLANIVRDIAHRLSVDLPPSS
jgi:CheY-like chemotaxis protein